MTTLGDVAGLLRAPAARGTQVVLFGRKMLGHRVAAGAPLLSLRRFRLLRQCGRLRARIERLLLLGLDDRRGPWLLLRRRRRPALLALCDRQELRHAVVELGDLDDELAVRRDQLRELCTERVVLALQCGDVDEHEVT